MKYAIKFASVGRLVSVHLPEGAKGDMCRAVQNDVDFARWFLTGANPIMLRRCTHIPTDRFPVTDEMMTGLLDRTKCLADEARVITHVSIDALKLLRLDAAVICCLFQSFGSRGIK